MQSLRNTGINKPVKVLELQAEGTLRRRLMDMGITKGVQIVIKKVAPLGDPIEISLRGYGLSIRKADAEKIIVEEVQ